MHLKPNQSRKALYSRGAAFVKEGYEIIYIGHKGHDEAVGVVEEAPEHVH